MSELTFRSMMMSRPSGSVVGNWWHAIDKLTFGAILALFAVGLVLGLAASPPLAGQRLKRRLSRQLRPPGPTPAWPLLPGCRSSPGRSPAAQLRPLERRARYGC